MNLLADQMQIGAAEQIVGLGDGTDDGILDWENRELGVTADNGVHGRTKRAVAVITHLARRGAEMRARCGMAIGAFDALVGHDERGITRGCALARGLETNGMLQDSPVERLHKIAVEFFGLGQFRDTGEQVVLAGRVLQRKRRIAL